MTIRGAKNRVTPNPNQWPAWYKPNPLPVSADGDTVAESVFVEGGLTVAGLEVVPTLVVVLTGDTVGEIRGGVVVTLGAWLVVTDAWVVEVPGVTDIRVTGLRPIPSQNL